VTDPVAEALARFRARWRAYLARGGEPPHPAAFVPSAAHVRRAVLLALVRADIRARAARPGLARDVDDYRREFPELSEAAALSALPHEHPAPPARTDAVGRAAPAPDETTRASPGRASDLPSTLTAARRRADSFVAVPADDPAAIAAPGAGAGPKAAGLKAADIAHARPGDRIGDFELRTELGARSAGRVFLARQLSMQRLVALRLTDRAGGAPRPMARFDHPHIVRVYDQRLPTGDVDGTAALVWMEYLPGGTAEHLLALRRAHPGPASGALLLRAVDTAMEAKGEIAPSDSAVRRAVARLTWPETVAWIGRGLAGALDYASRQGIAHRAIKPANVVFTAEGVPKLADFALGPVGETRPPGPSEVASGTAEDIHALGVLLWELLTGESPAPTGAGSSPRPPAPAPTGEPLADCPPALRRVLATCLDPDPGRRWPDAGVLTRQLDLCLDQRARDLVDPPPDSWRRRLRPWRVPLVVAAVAVPNLLASLYNIDHNRALVTGRLSQRTQDLFAVSTLVSNVLFFGLAAILLTWWSRRVVTVPRGLARGERYSPRELAAARKAAILLGDRSVLVAFAFWMISAVTYPAGVTLAGDELAPHAFAHFLASHAVCGAIALAYPFFLVDFYIVRCVYPMLLGPDTADAEDVALLRGLRRRCVGYLLVAASIPLLAVAGVTLLPAADIEQIIVAVRVLCIGSIVMFVAVYLLFGALERDLAALERVVSPPRTAALTVVG